MINQSNTHDPVVMETIELAQEEVQRLTSLLIDYRSFARPLKLNLKPTSLKAIIEEVLRPMQNLYREGRISVKFDFEPNLPAVPADREKIKQLILNLCKNAIEAMPEGGTLTCKGYRSNGNVVIEITDSGTGIPEELDPFQLFKTTKPYGTGLGLAIVEQIVSEHHGTISYVSQAGQGTSFITTLPISE